MKFVEEIREELRKMEKGEVFLFIISLLSRQKTLFDKIASVNNWCENEIISSVYNEVKKNVLVPENFTYECDIDRTDIEYLGWEADEFYMQIIESFLDELFAFIEQLRYKEEVDYSFSQCNFDILESIVINQYGWRNTTEEMIISNEYIQLEYEREKRDLDKIKKGEFEIDEMQEMIIPIDGLF